MKILNIGSINIDHVYQVPHFVRPGETLKAGAYQVFPGGKGLNQSIALARAGARVLHFGGLCKTDRWLFDTLESECVGTMLLDLQDTPTGHAVIQVEPAGQNCILLFGGANQELSIDNLKKAIIECKEDDYVLLQNETNLVSEAINLASSRGLQIVFNPAPFSLDLRTLPLEKVKLLILNEVEVAGLTESQDLQATIGILRKMYPSTTILLTLGEQGCWYAEPGCELLSVAAMTVRAVDTTAAGDTFIGYFLAAKAEGRSAPEALEFAAKAAAICVTREGAASSIPLRKEVESWV